MDGPLGIDVVNDGELPRETYFLHFVRKIKGIDANNLVAKTVRNGAVTHRAVTITSKLEATEEWTFKVCNKRTLEHIYLVILNSESKKPISKLNFSSEVKGY